MDTRGNLRAAVMSIIYREAARITTLLIVPSTLDEAQGADWVKRATKLAGELM